MKSIYLLILTSVLFCSCRSSRSMQLELNPMKTSLFYELGSKEYFGNKENDIYLEFIRYSNLDYYTTIKRKSSYAIPLFFYNLEVGKFRTKLGEHSLTQTYREFLTEALLAECNSSTRFNLIDNQKDIAPDSAYRLKVNIERNETVGMVNLKSTSIIWFDDDFLEIPGNKVGNANTNLVIHITLMHNGEKVFDKSYSLNHVEYARPKTYSDSVLSNEACLDLMAESLSTTTKIIVENISSELDLLLIPY